MKRAQGFTLIELLVVIAIIAILAAILFPIFQAARAAGRRVTCASNLHQIGKGFKAYTQDWGELMPWSGGLIPWGYGISWPEQIMRYMGEEKLVFTCPETILWLGSLVMPSYSINWRMANVPEWGAGTTCGSTTAVNNPSKVIVIFEISKERKPNDWNVTDWDYSNEWQNDGECYGPSIPWWWVKFPGPHRGGTNILFLDGHVKTFRRWDSSQMTLDPARS